MCKICSELTTKSPKRRQGGFGVIIVNFELTLNTFHPLFCFYFWLWVDFEQVNAGWDDSSTNKSKFDFITCGIFVTHIQKKVELRWILREPRKFLWKCLFSEYFCKQSKVNSWLFIQKREAFLVLCQTSKWSVLRKYLTTCKRYVNHFRKKLS